MALPGLFSASCLYTMRAIAILGVTGSILSVPGLYFAFSVLFSASNLYLERATSILNVPSTIFGVPLLFLTILVKHERIYGYA